MKSLLKDKRGAAYVDTGVKILIAVVVGALLLGGLYALITNVFMPNVSEKIEGIMDYGTASSSDTPQTEPTNVTPAETTPEGMISFTLQGAGTFTCPEGYSWRDWIKYYQPVDDIQNNVMWVEVSTEILYAKLGNGYRANKVIDALGTDLIIDGHYYTVTGLD